MGIVEGYIWLIVPSSLAIIGLARGLISPVGSFTGFVFSAVILLCGLPEIAALILYILLDIFGSNWYHRYSKQEQERRKTSRDRFSTNDVHRVWTTSKIIAKMSIPALICLLQILEVNLPVEMLTSFYFTLVSFYLAESFLFVFSALNEEKQFLLPSLKRVSLGTPGCISFEGCIASLFGGFIVGLTAEFSTKLENNDPIPLLTSIQYTLIAFIGCIFLSIFLNLIQKTVDTESRGIQSCSVHLPSVIFVLFTDYLFQHYQYECISLSLIITCLIVLFVSPLSTFMARNVLHISISIVIFILSEYVMSQVFISIVAFVFSLLALPQIRLNRIWERFDKNDNKSVSVSDSGIFLYSVVTGYIFYCFPNNIARRILFPMYFSDPFGSIISSSYFKRGTNGVTTVLINIFAFSFFQFLGGILIYSTDILDSFTLSSNLALVKIAAPSFNNLLLPMTVVLLNDFHAISLELVLFVAFTLISQHFFFGKFTNGRVQSLYQESIKPGTIFSIFISITIVMIVTLLDELSVERVEQFLPAVLFGFFMALLSHFQANVYLIGLKRLYYEGSTDINNEYKPVSGSDSSLDSLKPLVFLCLLTSTFNSYCYGNLVLFWTVVLNIIIGSIYVVKLPKFIWQPFLYVCTSWTFMARGAVIPIGITEYFRKLVVDETGLVLKPCSHYKYLIFLAVFLTGFGSTIGLFKSILDMAHKSEEGISTSSIRFNAKYVIVITNFIFAVLYFIAALYWLSQGSIVGSLLHVVTFLFLAIKLNDTVLEGPGVINSAYSSYNTIWKAFYLEYILVGGIYLFDRL